MSGMKTVSVSVAVLGLLSCEIFAQLRLDTRTRRQDPNYSYGTKNLGNALDANPMYGSGGYNTGGGTAINQAAIQDMSSINRQRGLSYFHGDVPSITNTLGGSTNRPLRGIDKFESQSVSAADVIDGSPNLYNPKAAPEFISRREGVMTSGIVARSAQLGITPFTGNNRPDEQILRADKARQVGDRYRVEGGPRDENQLKSLMYLEGGGGLLSERMLNSQPGSIPVPTNAREMMQMQNAIERIDGKYGAYGLTNTLGRDALATQIAQFDEQSQPDNRISGMIENPLTGRLGEEPADDAVDERTDPYGTRRDTNVLSPNATGLLEPGEEQTAFGSQYRYIDPQLNVDRNQDAYVDLLMELKAQQKAQKEALEDARKKAEAEKRQDVEKFLNPEKYDPTNPDNILGLNRINPKEAEKQNVVFDDRSRIVIQDLAGNSHDLFNQYMNQAKNAMQKGSYYDASHDYDLAIITNGNNPLPWLGGALAKFGAGEWASAGYKLQVALTKFPELMNVRFDLKKLMPSLNVNQQADSYEHWLLALQTPSQRLLLLGMFIQDQTGNTKGAVRHANELLKLGTAVPAPIRKYAIQIAGVKTPAAEKK